MPGSQPATQAQPTGALAGTVISQAKTSEKVSTQHSVTLGVRSTSSPSCSQQALVLQQPTHDNTATLSKSTEWLLHVVESTAAGNRVIAVGTQAKTKSTIQVSGSRQAGVQMCCKTIGGKRRKERKELAAPSTTKLARSSMRRITKRCEGDQFTCRSGACRCPWLSGPPPAHCHPPWQGPCAAGRSRWLCSHQSPPPHGASTCLYTGARRRVAGQAQASVSRIAF